MSGIFSAAVDLGTTTIEVSLIRKDGTVAAKHGFLNPQRKYGSDVISRMTYLKNNPGSEELKNSVIRELDQVIRKMLSWQREGSADKVVVTCNTVMGAILAGISTESLSIAPFKVPFDETIETSLSGIPMYIMPGASQFIGSDSCGGAWSLDIDEDELLMDLGTNGEMILCHNGELYGTSAACGPAFENCVRAQGIYGKTVLSAIAELLRRNRLPGDGTLPAEIAEKGIESGGVFLTADIIRAVMLAKAALAASFRLLSSRAGLDISELKRIYLAGGFGFHLSLRDAATTGLIPEALRDRVVISGNTSLDAAGKLAVEDSTGYDLFRRRMHTLQFAGDPEYEKLFYDELKLEAG